MRTLLLGTVGSLCLIGTALADPPPEAEQGANTAAEASMGAAGKGVIADGQSGFGFGEAAAMNAPNPGGFGNDFSASAVGADVGNTASGGISSTASSDGLGGSASGGVGGTASGGVGGAGSGGVGGGASGGVGGSASGGVGGAGSGGVGGGASAGGAGGGSGGAGGVR